jgi:L-threonylcarbamoyladenylate synthase
MQDQLKRAVEELRSGELVAFPTETVYGLGADALNPSAIQKVFAAKGRPADHPLIVHIATIEQLNNWAINIPDIAYKLANYFWPGPLTLVLTKHTQVSNLITGNQDTIAIRIPQHPLTLAMLQQFGSGIVGPSANAYGRISPTSAQHVKQSLGNKVNYILDGGPCEIGIESTIINLTTNTPQILRQGVITQDDLVKVIGDNFSYQESTATEIRVPGSTKAHYSPTKPLYLVSSQEFLITVKTILQQGLNYSYLSLQPCPMPNDAIIWIHAKKQPQLYAKNLYSYLHQLDAVNSQGIIVEMPPNEPSWAAIRDRLTRAGNDKLILRTPAQEFIAL